jgi:hypothetical protein
MTGTSFIPALIVILVLARIKKIINRFRDSGAVSPQTSRTPEELNIRRSILFNRLVKRKVLVEVTADRFYLHENNLEEYNRTRRMRVISIVIVLILLIMLDIYIMHF